MFVGLMVFQPRLSLSQKVGTFGMDLVVYHLKRDLKHLLEPYAFMVTYIKVNIYSILGIDINFLHALLLLVLL